MTVFVVADLVNQGAAPSSSRPAATPTILDRLRSETRGEHDAIERVLDLMGASLSRESYRHRLENFYGFYSPLEAALKSGLTLVEDDFEDETVLAFERHSALALRLNKTAQLQQDLRLLGVKTENLPLCRELPSLDTQAELLGCLYVMEGATLGGQLISRHIRATLDITPSTGGSYFDGYANETGKMWQAMRHLLVGCAINTHTEDAMVANAIATFTCLRDWCDPANSVVRNDIKTKRGPTPRQISVSENLSTRVRGAEARAAEPETDGSRQASLCPKGVD